MGSRCTPPQNGPAAFQRRHARVRPTLPEMWSWAAQVPHSTCAATCISFPELNVKCAGCKSLQRPREGKRAPHPHHMCPLITCAAARSRWVQCPLAATMGAKTDEAACMLQPVASDLEHHKCCPITCAAWPSLRPAVSQVLPQQTCCSLPVSHLLRLWRLCLFPSTLPDFHLFNADYLLKFRANSEALPV